MCKGISKLYRDSRAFRIFEGPTEALNMYLGSKALEKNNIFDSFYCDTLMVINDRGELIAFKITRSSRRDSKEAVPMLKKLKGLEGLPWQKNI